MDIILDTNIYEANFSLSGAKWDALAAYLNKTQSELIIPYVVQEELLTHYKAKLKSSLNDLKDDAASFKAVAIQPEHQSLVTTIFSIKNRDQVWLEEQGKNYAQHIREKMSRVQFPEQPELPIKPIVDRALKKERPFKEGGTGFKDAVLWQSSLVYADMKKETQIVFVTENSKDFGAKKLFPHLDEEARSLGIDVKYYNNLEDFIKENFEPIKYITVSAENIDITTLEGLLELKLKETNPDIDAFLLRESTQDAYYHSAQGVYKTSVRTVSDVVIRDVSPDFKYAHAKLILETDIVALGDFYTEYGGSYDYEVQAHQSLDLIPANLEVGITMKISGEPAALHEMEVTNIQFLQK